MKFPFVILELGGKEVERGVFRERELDVIEGSQQSVSHRVVWWSVNDRGVFYTLKVEFLGDIKRPVFIVPKEELLEQKDILKQICRLKSLFREREAKSVVKRLSWSRHFQLSVCRDSDKKTTSTRGNCNVHLYRFLNQRNRRLLRCCC